MSENMISNYYRWRPFKLFVCDERSSWKSEYVAIRYKDNFILNVINIFGNETWRKFIFTDTN